MPPRGVKVGSAGVMAVVFPHGRARGSSQPKTKKIGDKPEAHLSWIVQLLERHISQLRSHIPEIQADLSLLVHDRNFEINELPEKLLKSAVSIGDLEIEVPERGIDVVLTPRNVSTYIR